MFYRFASIIISDNAFSCNTVHDNLAYTSILLMSSLLGKRQKIYSFSNKIQSIDRKYIVLMLYKKLLVNL